MQKLFKDFIKCGILGWCLEITFTALHSLQQRKMSLQGTTSLWMFPIYGAGCLLKPVCSLVKGYLCPLHFYGGICFGIFPSKERIMSLELRKGPLEYRQGDPA